MWLLWGWRWVYATVFFFFFQELQICLNYQMEAGCCVSLLVGWNANIPKIGGELEPEPLLSVRVNPLDGTIILNWLRFPMFSHHQKAQVFFSFFSFLNIIVCNTLRIFFFFLIRYGDILNFFVALYNHWNDSDAQIGKRSISLILIGLWVHLILPGTELTLVLNPWITSVGA